jgi:hypothetical protein
MKRKTVAVLKWTGLAVIVLGAIYAALYIDASLLLRREYAALKASGRPMSLEEMLPPRLADADNAAIPYEAAVKLLQSEPPIPLAGYIAPTPRPNGDARVFFGLTGLLGQLGIVAGKSIETPPEPAATGQFRKLLQNRTVSEALAVLIKGTERKGYDLAGEYARAADYFFQMSKRSPQYINLAIILHATARQYAADGNHGAAWHAAIANLRFADARKNVAWPSYSIARLAMSSIRAIAAVSPPSDQQNEEIASVLRSFDDYTQPVRGIDYARLFAEGWTWNKSFAEIQSDMPLTVRDALHVGLGEPERLIFLHDHCPVLRIRDHAVYLRIMRTLTEIAATQKSFNDAVNLARPVMDDVPSYCITTRYLLRAGYPQLRNLAPLISHMTTMAAARVTRAGLAALRYRREKGVYPANLQSLNLNDLFDPFTGKPLIYRATAKGFTVYSVGENSIDDGGAKSEKSDLNLGLFVPGIHKIEYDDVKPDIVWSHND